MSYAPVTEVDIDAIPVIDVGPLADGPEGEIAVGRQLLNVVQRIGFFYVSNHGVDPALIDEVLNQAKTFFSRPEVEKNQIRVNNVHRGFLPIGEATMSGAPHEDFKESFVWGWKVAADDPDIVASRGILAPNCWPDFQPDMAPVLGRYIETINGLGICLLRAFAAGLVQWRWSRVASSGGGPGSSRLSNKFGWNFPLKLRTCHIGMLPPSL